MLMNKNIVKRLNDLEAQIVTLTSKIEEIINTTNKPKPRKTSGKICSATRKSNQSSVTQ